MQDINVCMLKVIINFTIIFSAFGIKETPAAKPTADGSQLTKTVHINENECSDSHDGITEAEHPGCNAGPSEKLNIQTAMMDMQNNLNFPDAVHLQNKLTFQAAMFLQNKLDQKKKLNAQAAVANLQNKQNIQVVMYMYLQNKLRVQAAIYPGNKMRKWNVEIAAHQWH